MNSVDFSAVNQLILQQEAALQFDRFNSRVAWELGKMMAEAAMSAGTQIAICIRRLNGYILFQYATDETTINNQNWMMRKFNTVSLMERSSLGAAVMSRITGETVATHGQSDKDYVFCGGGFPIRIKDSGIVGVITVSNLPHVQDHNFIIRNLSKYLGVDIAEVEVDF